MTLENFYTDNLHFYTKSGETLNIRGIPRKTAIRQISTLQLKRVVWKGCKSFAVTIINEENTNNEDKLKLEDIPSLRGYSDFFSEEIPGLPPKRELEFTIELVPGAVPSSKAPYQVNILELNELKK